MSRRKKLPPDWSIDAMAAEAKRRGCSYGQIIAQTTVYERDQIREEYRKHHDDRLPQTRQQEQKTRNLDAAEFVQHYREKLDY